jgi:hypothetical protein
MGKQNISEGVQTEGIISEQYIVFGKVTEHAVRPMEHRRFHKNQPFVS